MSALKPNCCYPCCPPCPLPPPVELANCCPPCCQPCCPEIAPEPQPCCPTCCPPIEPPKILPPDIMVCYKIESKGDKNKKSKIDKKKRSKSREIRAGILYRGCDCEQRNGLQDQCPRTGCHGSPECLTKPEPICGPSEFANGKHLGKNYYKTFLKENEDEEDGGRQTVEYNCFPATVTLAST